MSLVGTNRILGNRLHLGTIVIAFLHPDNPSELPTLDCCDAEEIYNGEADEGIPMLSFATASNMISASSSQVDNASFSLRLLGIHICSAYVIFPRGLPS